MGRYLTTGSISGNLNGIAPENPITGRFGTGQIRIIATSGSFVVPDGISSVRVRMWGAGGSSHTGGGGGGFALKIISNLNPNQSIPVTVGRQTSTYSEGGTSSFGNFVSATGGSPRSTTSGGSGIGGDINYTGGAGLSGGGGGAANLFGPGGDGTRSGRASGRKRVQTHAAPAFNPAGAERSGPKLGGLIRGAPAGCGHPI